MISQLDTQDRHPSIPEDKDTFGRFMGKWSLEMKIFHPDGTVREFPGEWHFFRIMQGRGIKDVWMIPDNNPASPDDFHEYGITIRTLNPKTEKWQAVWFGPIQNQLFRLDVEDNGDTIDLTEVGYESFPMRWQFFDIRENSFQWKSEIKGRKMSDWFMNYHMKLQRIRD